MSEIKGFGPKLKRLLAPEAYVHDLGGDWPAFGDEFEINVVQHRADKFDFEAVRELFFQLGNYFELVEPLCYYEPVWTDEVGEIAVCQVHANNSRHDTDRDPHAKCLTLDPYPNDPQVMEYLRHLDEQMRLAGHAVPYYPADNQIPF